MGGHRVEVRIDDDTMRWLRLRANSAVRPRDWKVQDEIREMLRYYRRQDVVNGVRAPQGGNRGSV